jgi:type II secretory pathway component HofQ
MKKIIMLLFLALTIIARAQNPFNVGLVELGPGAQVSIVGAELDLSAILLELATISNKNIIFIHEVHDKISLNLQKVNMKDAMFAVLSSADLGYIELGRDLYIGKEQQLDNIAEKYKKQQGVTKKYTLTHLPVDKFIAGLLKEQLITKKDIILIDKSNNSIVIKNVASETIESYIKAYDIVIKQVRIKAYIVSVDQDYLRELGLDFKKNLQLDTKKSLSSIWSGKLNDFSSFLALKMHAIDALGHGELLSSPELITRDNHTAFIETGEEIPYIKSAIDKDDSIVFKKAVLGLKVLPQILPKNKVDMHITIKQDQPGEVYASALSIRTRKIDTDTIVASGQTLVLGGIFEQHKTTTHEGVPLLQEVPLLGRIFSKENINNKKRQLLIFITPEIIS